MRAMNRRLTAWLTLLALVTAVVLPMHAVGHRADGPGGDFCSALTPGKAPVPPTAPASGHADPCGLCCACSGGAIVSPPLAASSPIVAGHVVAGTLPDARVTTASRTSPQARGPPFFA